MAWWNPRTWFGRKEPGPGSFDHHVRSGDVEAELGPVADWIGVGNVDQFRSLSKAIRQMQVDAIRSGQSGAAGNIVDIDILPNLNTPQGQLEAAAEPKGIYTDPFSIVQQLGFRERPSAITYQVIDSIYDRLSILKSIDTLRISQASAFCTPQPHKFETGFRVKMRDAMAKPGPAEKKFIAWMEEALLMGGTSGSYLTRDGMEQFVRKYLWESLRYDAAPVELIPDYNGRPCRWLPKDGKTIKLADSNKLYPEDDPEAVFAVEVYDNVIIAEYNKYELAYEVRNPRNDIRSFGYGLPEAESLVTVVTWLLLALTYNASYFQNGTTAKGILNLKGPIPEKHLRAFRRMWYQMLTGASNFFRTPITNAEEIQWISLQTSNKDMEYGSWADFLIKAACAEKLTDPVEINFKYGNQSGRSMFEGAQRAKAQESRERGLRPLLRHLGRVIDKYIIWPHSKDFTIEFVGLESQTPKELADLMTQRVRTMYMVDELRMEQDLPALPDGKGQVILDANWMNFHNMVEQRKEAQKQQAQMAAQGVVLGPDGKPMAGSGAPAAPTGPKSLEQVLGEINAKTLEPKGKQEGGQSPREVKNELQGEYITEKSLEKAKTTTIEIIL